MTTPATGDETIDNESVAVLDLEPTMVFEPPGTSPASRMALGVGMASGTFGSLSVETNDLRRERIAKVSFILAIIYLILMIWNLITLEHTSALIWATMALRLFFVVLISGLLFSPLMMTAGQTKAIEWTLFLGLTTLVAFAQYFVSVLLLKNQDMLTFVAFQKNGILQMITIMLLYGSVVPNKPRPAATMLCTMALLPSISYLLVMESPECDFIHDKLKSTEQIGSNVMFLWIGAMVAIFSTWTVNGLRTELHKAKKLGQYRLGEKIGSGGMGDVFMAEHEFLKRPCALKLIKTETLESPVALARFELEVQSAAKLAHPNTIEIYDYGHTEDGTFYYVMEYLNGLSLADLITRFGPMPPGRVVYLFRQVSAGLAEAHAMGLIHRDLKPANIYIAVRGGETDVAKVLDFGLVKDSRDTASPALTADQSVSGTPQFMAPEQASGKRDLDSRLDIYALGCVMYFCLTGRPPFTHQSAFEVMIAHVRDAVDPPSKFREGIPKDLEDVVLRCLAKSPADRFADVKALGRALAACEVASTWTQDDADRWWAASSREMRTELVTAIKQAIQ